jgi:hypothetical protein
MIDKIDISNIDEESYQLNDNIEILFNEEGFFIFSSSGLFSMENFKNCTKNSQNQYILINEDKDTLKLESTDYEVIMELCNSKLQK